VADRSAGLPVERFAEGMEDSAKGEEDPVPEKPRRTLRRNLIGR
jgi:hypothetical protein